MQRRVGVLFDLDPASLKGIAVGLRSLTTRILFVWKSGDGCNVITRMYSCHCVTAFECRRSNRSDQRTADMRCNESRREQIGML